MLRTTASLSIIAASFGNSSQIWMPGTFVLIGLNSPRISAGASGLRSHMSWCGGPPGKKTLISDLCVAPNALLSLGSQKRRQRQPAGDRTADDQEISSREAVAEPAAVCGLPEQG